MSGEQRHIDAVFIDRDGTIGGNGFYIHPRDFEPYPFTRQAISMLKDAGVKVFAFTNQTHISHGDVQEGELAAQCYSLGFDGVYICPHLPEHECECRKPKPGLLYRAATEHGLDLTRTAVIGDLGATDMVAAHTVGAVRVLVRTGLGDSSLGEYRHTWPHVTPDYVARDLLDAVRWIVGAGDM